MGAYGDSVAVTPVLDALAATSTIFATALSQIAWCAPSRNSFLCGRRPQQTQAYNFLDDFRSEHPEWVTLPGMFRDAGYYATSVGKVFHPKLPPNFDAASSWSDTPYFVDKSPCSGGEMACALGATSLNVDDDAANELIARLAARPASAPFFAAIGFQAPRLPWVYAPAQLARYPVDMPIAANGTASGLAELEYFRPTEIDQYSDVRNVTHSAPMQAVQQRAMRRAYYACVSGVDAALGRVLEWLEAAGLSNDTVIAVVADHGQQLGEHNLWSMMSTLDAGARVPLLLRGRGGAAAGATQARVYAATPVELVDVMPTLAALAGLPPPPASWALPGEDLSPALAPGGGAPLSKDAAFSQITRCGNCSAAYGDEAAQCTYDAQADAAFSVPCALAPRNAFDWMGLSVRTRDWRYTAWCRWDGARLAPDWAACDADSEELFDHRGEAGVQPLFRPEAEASNVARDPALAPIVVALRARLLAQFPAAK